MKQNEKLILVLVGLIFLSCKQESGLQDDLYNIVFDYQKKNPIPSDEEIRKTTIFKNPRDAKYVFEVNIDKNQKDTLIYITLESRGVKQAYNPYGIYSDRKLKPTYIIDENKLGKNFIKEYKQKDLESLTFKEFVIDDTVYPVYFYKVHNGKLVLYDSIRGNMKR